jgi:hypothetical protein
MGHSKIIEKEKKMIFFFMYEGTNQISGSMAAAIVGRMPPR